MQIRTDRGWIKAGLAVLVAGVLGGGLMAATGIGPRGPKKVTADGATNKPVPGDPAGNGFDLAAAAPVSGEQAPTPDPVVGDKVLMGDDGGSVTVSAVEDNVSAGRLFGAGEDSKYIAAEVKGCSGPNEKNITFEPSYFLLRLDDGTIRDPGPGAKKPSLDGGTVPPGKCLAGWVTFTVPEGALATAVIYDGSRRLTWTVPLAKNAKPTTTTTMKAGAATASSSTTSTTSSKAKVSSSTTTTTKRKAASGGAGSTTSTTRAKASSTTTSTKPAATSTSTTKPTKSSTTTTTTAPTVVTAPTGEEG